MARFYRRRKFCRFTAEGITHIDYKEFIYTRKFISTGTFTSIAKNNQYCQ